jgi:hypothetical protein
MADLKGRYRGTTEFRFAPLTYDFERRLNVALAGSSGL